MMVVYMDETIEIMYIMIIFNAPQRQAGERPSCIKKNANNSPAKSFNSDHGSSASYDCVSSSSYALFQLDYIRIMRDTTGAWAAEKRALKSASSCSPIPCPFLPCAGCGQKRADRLTAAAEKSENIYLLYAYSVERFNCNLARCLLNDNYSHLHRSLPDTAIKETHCKRCSRALGVFTGLID